MSDHINETLELNPTESTNDLKNNAPEIDKMVTDALSSFDETINLSTTSKQLEAIKKSLQDIPEINEARVLYFKTEIELGNYAVDCNQIAMNMLGNTELV